MRTAYFYFTVQIVYLFLSKASKALNYFEVWQFLTQVGACARLRPIAIQKNPKIFISSDVWRNLNKEYLSTKKMNLNNPSLPLRHEATDEVAIEIPSQNENPQIQIQQARMVQVTIGRPMMPSQTGNQQIASGQCVIIGSIVIITGLILIGALFISWIFSIPFKLAFIIVAFVIMILSKLCIFLL